MQARFITRGQNGKPDLILGACGINSLLKPDTVYQIDEILGEFTIRELGPINDGIVWGMDASTILRNNGKYLTLTEGEYRQLCKSKSDK